MSEGGFTGAAVIRVEEKETTGASEGGERSLVLLGCTGHLLGSAAASPGAQLGRTEQTPRPPGPARTWTVGSRPRGSSASLYAWGQQDTVRYLRQTLSKKV